MNSLNIHDYYQADELAALRELDINPHDLIFIHRSRLPFMKHRQFVCHLRLKDGLYSFDLPPKLPRRYKKQIAATEKKLLYGNNLQMRKLMLSAKKNAEFVQRFNSELFLKHSFFKGGKLTLTELFDFYRTAPYTDIVNLSGDADKSPFIALYAITFYACTPEDIYTVDGIFSMQPERHADNAKKTAGNAVFNLIMRNNKDEITQILHRMGEALAAIQPPRVNLADAALLAKNYTLFEGLSHMGRVFCKLSRSPEALRAAQELVRFAPLVELCDAIAAIADEEDYRRLPAYAKCREFT
jgi:hypothetical protein